MTNPIDTKDLPQIQRQSIDYMITNMQDHHMQLSSLADQKAQILLGVCSIIVTFCLTQLSTGNYSFGLIVLVIGMSASMIPAILAIMPTLSPRRPETQVPIHKKRSKVDNLLFFASFAKLEEEHFLEEMNQVFQNSDELYKAWLVNVYNNGKVMANDKYRRIGISYRIFLAGMVLGVVVSILEVLPTS